VLVCRTIAELRSALQDAKHTALVPTMGNLHAGHLALVGHAKRVGSETVASIFVNRLQFAPNEDFDSYPRTFESDCAQLAAAGCDIVFAPLEKEFYPEPQTFKVQPPPELSDMLEGHFRPGFYVGVCTVVMKLFQCVQPRFAVFGKKDYQQLMVIRRMVDQFAMPIDIIAGETERAPDGLALSSRNGYLSAAERAEAPRLQALLRDVRDRTLAGESIAQTEAHAMAQLTTHGWKPDYVVVRRRADLQTISGEKISTAHIRGQAVVLAAARIGKTRLIDQLEF
jgi:pantoate--beta-alanine ligase